MRKYNIVRHSLSIDKSRRIVKKWLDLSQAQAHCKDPNTKKEGVYFEGFTECKCKATRKNCKCK